jgi:isopentenyl-diphosphate delta-isomerase
MIQDRLHRAFRGFASIMTGSTISGRVTASFEEIVQSLDQHNVAESFPDVSPAGSQAGSPATQEDHKLFAGYDEEQIKLMDELCIVLDWNDRVIGSASKKTCHLRTNINKGLLHRAFSVFLFDRQGKLLLQQRADEKITFPGMWTNTCCSHPLAIPSELGHGLESSVKGVKRAAQRKLDQELGIKKDSLPLEHFDFLTRIHYVAPSTGAWGEHEIDYILFIKANPVLHVNPNEVKDTKYVSKAELKEMFKDKNLTFTPWFKLICENYLFKWWDHLDNVDRFRESEIRRML